MLAFHQWGFSSGCEDRIPVPGGVKGRLCRGGGRGRRLRPQAVTLGGPHQPLGAGIQCVGGESGLGASWGLPPALTCASARPVFGAHEAPHGVVPGVTALAAEAVPATCGQSAGSGPHTRRPARPAPPPPAPGRTFQEEEPAPTALGLLQVLEDTCRCQDFNPNEYDLKFQRSVLDLSLQWRFANLPNNAKLEMVPVSRSREGPQNTVRIAVQLEDGSRLQGAFCSGQTLWELLSHFPETRECLQQPGEATPVCVSMRDEVTGAAALRSATLLSLGLTGGSATIRFVTKRVDAEGRPETGVARSKTPGSPADQVAGGPLPPLNSGELSCGDLSRQGEVGTSGACHADGPKPADAPAKQSVQEPGPAPFVPFSGGGQRLGGPSGSGRSLMSPSAKLPTSTSSPGGPSKPKKSKPGEEPPQEPEPPVDRDAVVCHPDLEDLLQAWPAELPDEFFEVTVDDVRRRLAQLKSERQRLEEAPLVTKAFREAQIKEKLERYPKVAVRVLFPDRYILQGFFRPSETVGDLRDFVRHHLGDPELPFYLFITPPKTVLDDHTLTLFQANLFPAALVHLGAQEPAGLCLAPRLLEHTVPPSTADMLVARCMSRAAGSPPPLPAPELPPAPEEGAPGPPEPVPGTAQPVRRSLGKVPKWLKLPAGKR